MPVFGTPIRTVNNIIATYLVYSFFFFKRIVSQRKKADYCYCYYYCILIKTLQIKKEAYDIY